MVASGFILSIPLYADATYFRLFREELFAGNEAKLANHPVDYAPMAFTFDLNVAGRKSPQWADAVKVDHYLSTNALRTIQFPIEQTVRRFRTDGYYMYPPLDPKINWEQILSGLGQPGFHNSNGRYHPVGFRPVSATIYFHIGIGGSASNGE